MDKVFCQVPWSEIHISADGTYTSCGAHPNHMFGTEEGKTHNVFQMPISEWVNSQHQKNARLSKLEGKADKLCEMCYTEEAIGSSSKRIKENLKSYISTINFYKSYNSSPDRPMFEYSKDNQGLTENLKPNSYHISLGNECNLACKICKPLYSSRIAVEEKSKGNWLGPTRLNWTVNDLAWNHVVDYMCSTDNLKFVHVIGGEPLLNPKFEDLIDRLLAAGKTDIYLGFTTNGTIVDIPLIEKLNAFRHVDIGISIETADLLNDYIRKGTNTLEVLDNIDTYLKYRCDSHVYVTVRPVPSALSVHTLDDLYRWCISRKVDVMTNILVRPYYQQIQHLPAEIKQRLLDQYSKWEYCADPMTGLSNPRDPNRFREHIDSEIRAIINALKLPNDARLTDELYAKLKLWGWLDDPNIEKYFKV
jgi:MoaA/NifB/PqqE/SkfB family radical SAM enzyme